jgi:hypothetical protein
MYDVTDPEEPGHTVPSRLALRGQRPGPADVAAAARCRLRHVEVEGRYLDVVHPSTYLVGSDIYSRVNTDLNGRYPTPTRADDPRLTGNGRFLVFDGGLSLDHAERLRPPDHRWGEGGRTHVWEPRSLPQATIMSGPDGISGGFSTGSRTVDPAVAAELVACLAAAIDDQRCRFDRGGAPDA